MNLLGLVVEWFCEPDNALMGKSNLERRLVLDEELNLAVQVRVRVASREALEHDRSDRCRLRQQKNTFCVMWTSS